MIVSECMCAHFHAVRKCMCKFIRCRWSFSALPSITYSHRELLTFLTYSRINKVLITLQKIKKAFSLVCPFMPRAEFVHNWNAEAKFVAFGISYFRSYSARTCTQRHRQPTWIIFELDVVNGVKLLFIKENLAFHNNLMERHKSWSQSLFKLIPKRRQSNR